MDRFFCFVLFCQKSALLGIRPGAAAGCEAVSERPHQARGKWPFLGLIFGHIGGTGREHTQPVAYVAREALSGVLWSFFKKCHQIKIFKRDREKMK